MSFLPGKRGVGFVVGFRALLLLLVVSFGLQTGAAAQQATALRGTVADPDGAVIQGATVTLTPAKGAAITVQSKGDGSYSFAGVPAGSYTLVVTMPGFGSFVRPGVKVAGDSAATINVKLQIQDEKQTVTVNADAPTVSVDADSNASSTVIKGKDLDALSDDPDELSNELSALAGPSAGPNGGQIYIDGFTGGQLPPKSSIAEIRINQNPFSAQYDQPGFGRVEVFTKPGTDKFHGSAQLNYTDRSFDTGSPFIGTATQPNYHTLFFLGSLTGPVRKNASFSVGGSYRDIQNNSIVDPSAVYATSQTSGTVCNPGQAGCQIFLLSSGNNNTGYRFAQFSPQTRYDITPRFDIALGEKNRLTLRYQFEKNDQYNQGIGGSDLPSTGYNSLASENTIQVVDTQTLRSNIINETRFEYQRETSNQNPLSTAATIVVQGAFTAGGYNGQTSVDTQNHFEVQNYTSIALARHFIRLGGRLRTSSETNTSTGNSNGTLTYTDINTYAAGVPTAISPAVVDHFQQTFITQPTVQATAVDVGIYAEDEWKIRPNVSLSYGLRYEAQNFIHDQRDFAPRLALSYGVGKKTVIRLGYGLFYSRFVLGNELNIFHNNGLNQKQFTVLSGQLTAACTPTNLTACSTNAGASALTINTIADNLRAPYQQQINVGLDRQLIKAMTVSVNYQNIRGVHQFVSEDANYPVNGVYPTKSFGGSTLPPFIYQYQSEGEFEQNQLIVNTRYGGKRGSVFGYYVLNYAKSDTSGVGSFSTVPYNLKADYGRASFDVRNRLFVGGSFNAPFRITLSPLLVASSGQPYNITTGRDNNQDSIYNDRPVFVAAGTAPIANGFVKSINGCGTFATPGTAGITATVPINYCTGPAAFTFNLRVVKTFGFGPKLADTRNSGQQDNNQNRSGRSGGGGGATGGNGGGGRGGPGGGFGGPGIGGASSGRKFNLAIGASAQNLFNIVDRTSPVGTLSSPAFGTSTQLAGRIYTSDDAVRRVGLQIAFSF